MINLLNTASYLIFFFLLIAMLTFFSIYNDKIYMRNLQDPFE